MIDYATHVRDLSRAFHVICRVVPGMCPDLAGAGHLIADEDLPLDQQRKLIMIAPVTDETTYAVALHELGHCLHPTGIINRALGSKTMRMTSRASTMDDVRYQLLEERSAWEWAHQNALEWTPVMTSVERMCLWSYEKRARQFGVKK